MASCSLFCNDIINACDRCHELPLLGQLVKGTYSDFISVTTSLSSSPLSAVSPLYYRFVMIFKVPSQASF